MGLLQLTLPDELTELIDREVAEGKAASQAEFLIEAARHYAEALASDNEIIAAATAGIADIEAGRYSTINTPEELDTMQQHVMFRVRGRLASDKT